MNIGNNIKIISVDIPKCAGTSLHSALEQAFGQHLIYDDYDDSPFNPLKPVNTDPDYFKKFSQKAAYGFLESKRVIHGHFHPNKYAALTPAIRVTVLREPVERMISHYYFWKNTPRHHHPLHDYVLDHALSLEEFAELEPIRRFYSGVFFKDVNMRLFNAIGATEQMDVFMRAFSRIALLNAPLRHSNMNPDDSYESVKNEILGDARRMQSLKQLLAGDIAFYEQWAGYGCS